MSQPVLIGYAKAGQNATSKEREIFTAVEEMPVFKEGNVLAYMARMVKYPVRAQEKGIQGKVIVSFVIDKAGRVTDPQVVRSVDQDLDREALRVVKALPDWKTPPGGGCRRRPHPGRAPAPRGGARCTGNILLKA